MPIYFLYTSPLMGVWSMDESWEEMLDLFSAQHPYMDDIRHIRSGSRKQEVLATRLLLKHLTGEELQIKHTAQGVPFLNNSHYNISISHTKGYAAVILGYNEKTGIDIEYRSNRAWKLRTRFLDEKELAFVDNSSNPIEIASILWCAKETEYKILQRTEIDFSKHFHVMPFDFSTKGYLQIQETRTLEKSTSELQYHVADNFIMTWKK